MKKILLLILVLLLITIGCFCYYSVTKKNIVNKEILNFNIENIKLQKNKTDFLDGNYISCATTNEDEKVNDTIWTDEIKINFQKIQEKWMKKFPNNILISTNAKEKVGVNNLSNIDDKNVYRLILSSKSVKNNIFSNGFSIEQKINYKSKDTLKEFISVKEYWWINYKWKLKKKAEYQNSYYKTY